MTSEQLIEQLRPGAACYIPLHWFLGRGFDENSADRLCSQPYDLLCKKFEFFLDEENTYELTSEDVSSIQLTGGFGHPETGELISGSSNDIFPFYVGTKKLEKLLTQRRRRSQIQTDSRVTDHGDICGDNYSRAMFETQRERTA